MHISSKLTMFSATIFALLAFAGNSVLCRLALLPAELPSAGNDQVLLATGSQAIDATSFTVLRLLSGSIALFVFVTINNARLKRNLTAPNVNFSSLFTIRSWLASFCLFVYAATFSFAYISLPTGAGALLLFGCVQLTMIVSSIMAKESLNTQKYMGVCLAFLGLCLLMYFQGNTNSTKEATGLALDTSLITGFILMVVSGIAWAIYTLLGRASKDPIIDTYANFTKSLLFCGLLCFLYLMLPATVTSYGITLALLSGIVSSALGYAVWYYVLPQLSRILAGVIQLLVPVIAAFGGAIWAQEAITLPLIIAQIMVLGGIALVIINKRKS
ncbi:DMT family transporter [Glaciecola petra]|uniref:DMT family transporter n=1 Tax=Glaciecola petra TaxID=3075602 RepID=A0ABU2ZSG5_9ALTE|nr:DMT family transporter [Aestuariibacter sp. P117]MDT0595578.1 DMT family transporter [Aestuariibacter sp. P117]